MNELALQKYVVDCVNHAGGFAHKMSNRFLVGVVDLLVKLPSIEPDGFPVWGRPAASVLEVKQRDTPKTDILFSLAVTPQQKHYLQRAEKAGMPAGVVSFLQVRGRGKKELRMKIYTLTQMENLAYHAHVSHHQPAATEAQVMEQLIAWHRECGK